MIATPDAPHPGSLQPGSHVCWVIDDPAELAQHTVALLEEGRTCADKLVVFGLQGSPYLRAMEPHVDLAVDPRAAFLGGGPLDADAMFDMFRAQTETARRQGHRGLRVIADMDWLAPLEPAPPELVAFELVLDRVVAELQAIVVCAYRRSSFAIDAISGVGCVHPINCGVAREPQFQAVAAGTDRWRLGGEVDIAVGEAFGTAIAVIAAADADACAIDVRALEFIDVAGMRAIADASVQHEITIRLDGASARLRRWWDLAGFMDAAPHVELVA